MSAWVQRYAGIGGVVGGLLWALTPLRQPVFGAGRTPDEGVTFFRLYNLVLMLIAVLLTLALVRLRAELRDSGRLFTLGWWTILVGHVLLFAGSVPAVVLGDGPRDVVMGGQDLGFLGAMVAGLGGILAGLDMLRRRRSPALASWLLLLTLPAGFLGLALRGAMGVSDDVLGLPLTVLYGGAWVVLGWSWIRQRDARDDREDTVPSTV